MIGDHLSKWKKKILTLRQLEDSSAKHYLEELENRKEQEK
jgi:hypothetical protein